MQTDTIKSVIFLYLFSKQVSWTKYNKTEKPSTQTLGKNQEWPCVTTPTTVHSATDIYGKGHARHSDYVLFFLLICLNKKWKKLFKKKKGKKRKPMEVVSELRTQGKKKTVREMEMCSHMKKMSIYLKKKYFAQNICYWIMVDSAAIWLSLVACSSLFPQSLSIQQQTLTPISDTKMLDCVLAHQWENFQTKLVQQKTAIKQTISLDLVWFFKHQGEGMIDDSHLVHHKDK